MSYAEGHRLYLELLADPASHVAIAVSNIDRPLSREGLILSDIYDLLWQSWPRRRRFTPYPRPQVRRRIDPAKQRRIRDALRSMGHGDLMDEIEGKR